MSLTEVIVSMVIFAMPVASTVQLINLHKAAESAQLNSLELLNAVDADRLALQATWMQIKPSTCFVYHSVIPMMTASNQVPVPNGIQRQIVYLKDGEINTRTIEGQALMVNWRTSNGQLLRQRLYTPMGLGLCW